LGRSILIEWPRAKGRACGGITGGARRHMAAGSPEFGESALQGLIRPDSWVGVMRTTSLTRPCAQCRAAARRRVGTAAGWISLHRRAVRVSVEAHKRGKRGGLIAHHHARLPGTPSSRKRWWRRGSWWSSESRARPQRRRAGIDRTGPPPWRLDGVARCVVALRSESAGQRGEAHRWRGVW
jgi:hypothetical protein